jgi:shikimate dehydrogenase
VAGIIGDPVTHSLSPRIHNAAFAAAGLDWVYVAFPVPRGRAAAALDAMRSLGLAGLNVTMPHKTDVAAACDVLTDMASTLRSVNTVARLDDGALLGDSTDGDGFVRSLREVGVTVEGKHAIVLGAGGAARAVALALMTTGASVTLWARRDDRAADAATAVGVKATSDVDRGVAEADIVVNATPVGMDGEAPPFDPSRLHQGQHVADLIYHPADTPLLAAARAAGANATNGLGMLVHQAALAFERWTGVAAPLDVMRAAASDRNLSAPRS